MEKSRGGQFSRWRPSGNERHPNVPLQKVVNEVVHVTFEPADAVKRSDGTGQNDDVEIFKSHEVPPARGTTAPSDQSPWTCRGCDRLSGAPSRPTQSIAMNEPSITGQCDDVGVPRFHAGSRYSRGRQNMNSHSSTGIRFRPHGALASGPPVRTKAESPRAGSQPKSLRNLPDVHRLQRAPRESRQ